jgi:hypothetical protein
LIHFRVRVALSRQAYFLLSKVNDKKIVDGVAAALDEGKVNIGRGGVTEQKLRGKGYVYGTPMLGLKSVITDADLRLHGQLFARKEEGGEGKRRQDAYVHHAENVQIGVVIAADVLYRGQAKGQAWQQQKDASQLQGFEAWAVSGACREEVASKGMFELYAVVRDQAGDRYLLHLDRKTGACSASAESGMGVGVWPDGAWYEGEFHEEKRHGHGSHHNARGSSSRDCGMGRGRRHGRMGAGLRGSTNTM